MSKNTNKDSPIKNTAFVFIDASNLWDAQRIKGRVLDYQKVMDYLNFYYPATSTRIFYYTAYPAEGTRTYDTGGKHRFLDFLSKGLGFEVKKKQLKRITIPGRHGQTIQEKGNMDVELTIDAVHYSKQFNTAILFTGDSDFLALVRHLQNEEKKVYIFSSSESVSQELKTSGDGYTDILEIKDDIWGVELQNYKQGEKGQ